VRLTFWIALDILTLSSTSLASDLRLHRRLTLKQVRLGADGFVGPIRWPKAEQISLSYQWPENTPQAIRGPGAARAALRKVLVAT
jgi:hypothetical protein